MCDVTEKKCTKCGEVKSLSEFNKNKKCKFGFRSECRLCQKKEGEVYRKKTYSYKNKRYIDIEKQEKECSKCFQIKSFSEFIVNKKSKLGIGAKCKHCKNIEQQKRRKNNPIIEKEYRDKYRVYYNNIRSIRNKEKRKTDEEFRKSEVKSSVKYYKKKIKEDFLFRVKEIIRHSIKRSIYKKKYTKKSRTHEILGCEWLFFKEYIKDQFTEGMTWENHGEWHLDHVVPISQANTEEEVIELNHWSNFQPLWAKDNLSKSDKF